MTIPANQASVSQWTGNGTTTTFNYLFAIASEDEILVVTTDTLDNDTTLTVGVDYTVAGVGDSAGGSITLLAGALTSGYTITLSDNVAASQTISYGNQSQFKASVHESSYDKLTRLCKKILNKLAGNILQLNDKVTTVDTEIPTPQALHLMRFNADATGIELIDQNELQTSAAYASWYPELFVNGTDFTAGTTTFLTLTESAVLRENTQVYINGVYQTKTSYSYDATTNKISWSPAIPSSAVTIEVMVAQTLTVIGSAGGYNVGTSTGQLVAYEDIPSIPAILANTNYIATIQSNAQYKNYVHNPSMAVSQVNGDGPTNVTLGTDYYGSDRHFTASTASLGGVYSVERGTLNNFKSYKVTATTATTTLTTTEQLVPLNHKFEAQDVYNLNGKEVTLSFKLNTNWTGNCAVVILNHDESRSYVTDVAVTSGENDCSVTLTLEAGTVDAIDDGIGMSIRIAGNNEATYQTATVDAWQAGTYSCSTSSTQWSKTINNYVEITEVQLVEGDTAPRFQPNSYAYDFDQCTRYSEVLDFPINSLISTGQCISTTESFGDIQYSQKRSAPSLSVLSGTIEAGNSTGFGAGGTAVFAFAGIINSRIQISSATGLVAGNASVFKANTAVTILVDANL